MYAVSTNDLYVGAGSTKYRKRYKRCSKDSDSDSEPEGHGNQVLNEIKSLRREVQDVLALSKTSKVPPGLKIMLTNTFKCSICHGVIRPPVAYARCCQSILGCESCSDTWYSGEDRRKRSCPLCRRERAFSDTGRVHALDEFLDCVEVFF